MSSQTTESRESLIRRFTCHNWDLVRECERITLGVEPYGHSTEGVYISKIYVPPKIRRRGYAREVMERLCQAADEESLDLYLWVQSDGPMTNLDLMIFYESLGFEVFEEVRSNDTMVRYHNQD